MPLHFEESELAARRSAVINLLESRNLDGILLFKQESMYYLTGYDTFGFCFFQCLYLGVDGRYFLLTRAPDLRQAQHTSDLEDIRVWIDGEGVDPSDDLKLALQDYCAAGSILGCEYNAYGLSAAYGKMLDAGLDGFCVLKDASTLVSELRVVKSDAEIEYVRKAASLADDAMDAAVSTAGPGVFEGDILAAMQGAVFKGGGDYPGNEFVIGSGAGALLCRYFSGRETVGEQDQLTLEYAGSYRRYHACLMQTFLTGSPVAEHIDMHRACADAMEACLQAIKPGETMGAVFSEHARVLDDVRKAASLADDAMDAAVSTAGPGVFEGDILAAMQGAVFKGGGDYPGNEFVIGSGAGALLCRYFSGRETVGEQDQLTLEYAGSYRRYHACLMQTFLTGSPVAEHIDMHRACADAMEACLQAIKPGETMGIVFSEHARALDEAGYREHRMNACGYSLGAMYTPMWMDFPMFYANNPYVMQANNIFFVHIILMNSDTGNSMTLGQTVRVTETGVELLSRQPTDLVIV